MRFFRQIWFWLWRCRLERGFEEEIRQHLESKVQENLTHGMSWAEAQRAARLEFGNPTLAKEHSRRSWGFPLLESILQDVGYAARQMRKNSGFTAVAVFTLALGIGANSAIFSIVNAVLLQPLLFHDDSRLVMIWQKDPKAIGDDVHISGPDYRDWSGQNDVFSGLAAYPEITSFELVKDQRVLEVTGLLATANLFTVVGAQPVLGRPFTADEEKTRAQVALISQGFWQEHFGGDPRILEKTVALNGEVYKVIGVLPARFYLPWVGEFSVLAPLPLETGNMLNRANHHLHVVARIRPGKSWKQAEANFNLVDDRIRPQRTGNEKNLVIRFGSIHEDNREIKISLLALMGAVGFVLLIACGNVANLLLSRGVGRRKEVAIRCAIGASRGRVVRQMATENLLLGLTGCAVGIGIAASCTPYMASQAAEHFRNVSGIAMDLRVAGFAILISLLTTALFGMAPVTACSKTNVNHELNEGGNTTSNFSYSRQKIRSLLVIGEVALALVVLIGAGLLIRAFLDRAAVNPGVRIDHVLAAEVHLKGPRYENPAAMRSYYERATQNLARIPGITQVSATSALPVGHGEIFFMSFAIPGMPAETGGEQPGLVRMISPGYFDLLGRRLVEGRDFAETDRPAAERVAIVNQTFVQRYFPGENAVGKSLMLTDKLNFHTDKLQPGPMRIVGVAPAIKHWCIGCEPHSDVEIYVPFAQAPAQDMLLLMRYSSDAPEAAAAIRQQLSAVDSTQAIYRLETMAEELAGAIRPFIFYPGLVSLFGFMALGLACTGVYAVISYSVAERKYEIGIRMALGATSQHITGMVLGLSARLVAIGVAVGVIAALGLTRFLSHLLHGVSPFDPLTFVVISCLLIMVAATASFVPAYHASKIDPLIALGRSKK